MHSAIKRTALGMIALCLVLTASPAFADGTQLNVQTSTATDGTVTAKVVLNGDLTVSGIQFALSYDDSKLQLTDSRDGDLTGAMKNCNESGKVMLVWYSVDGVPITGENSVLELTFAPKAGGNANIGFDSGSMSTMIVNSALSSVNVQTNGATVSLGGTGTVPSSTNPAQVIMGVVTPSPVYLPTETPLMKTMTIPAAERATPEPTPSPKATASADEAGSAPNDTINTEETMKTPLPAASATPVAVEDYAPPELAQEQDTQPRQNDESQIEVMGSAQTKASYSWLWIAGGAVLLAGAAYYILRRFNGK